MPNHLRDLTGQQFGKLTVLRRAENMGHRTRWECLCQFGKTHIVLSSNLIAGQQSCYCVQSPVERALAKISPEPNTGCWLWTAALSKNGYARLGGGGRVTVLVHRLLYEYFKGPIPEGLQLDHLCRVRHCVNPDHLEPVTMQENIKRGLPPYNSAKTHCPQGHPYSGQNLYVLGGNRYCKQCMHKHAREFSERKREKHAQ